MTGKQQPLNLTDFQKGENDEKRVFGGGISYMKEWDTICKCTDISEYRTWAFDGELSACRFRSICWRVFLNIFPSDSTKVRKCFYYYFINGKGLFNLDLKMLSRSNCMSDLI